MRRNYMLINSTINLSSIDSLEYINNKAKYFFDYRDYESAIKVYENYSKKYSIPSSLAVNIAKCYYNNKEIEKALNVLYSLPREAINENILLDIAVYENAIGNHDKAYNILLSLLSARKDYNEEFISKLKFNIGWHELRKGNFVSGFKHLNEGRKIGIWGTKSIEKICENKSLHGVGKAWNGKNKVNRLLYILENGLGDEFIYFRWCKYLSSKCNELIVACHKLNVELFANVCEYMNLQVKFIVHEELSEFVNYDEYVLSMSLIPICDKEIISPISHVEFPYIVCHENAYIKNKIKYDSKSDIKIGVKLWGNSEYEADQFRKVPREIFDELSKYGELYALHVNEQVIGMNNTYSKLVRNWHDSYTFVKNMNVIVSTCTSMAHFAGAINKKCIVLVPMVPYFTWCNEDYNNEWYESVKVIKQKKYNDWNMIKKELHDAIKEMISNT